MIRKKRVQISLHETVYQDLKDLAQFQGKSLSEVVELGALTYLGIIVGSTDFELAPNVKPLTVIQGGKYRTTRFDA